MNFLRSFQTREQFKTEIVGERDDASRFSDVSDYEHSTKKAAEMEFILGNALAVHERDNGSIHSLERYGSNSALEFGRRIATMRSKDELDRAESFGFDSRTSSLGSQASLPTFVRVDKEDSVLLSQRSWEEEKYDDQSLTTDVPKPPGGRSWNKLRREVYEESRERYNEDDNNNDPKRTQSIGRKALGFGKIFKDSSNRGYGLKSRSESEPIRKGYAKDYDVEVSLANKKKFWERSPSIIKAARARKEKSRGKTRDVDRPKQTRQQEELKSSNSFDAPNANVEESSLVESKPRVVLDMQEMHKGDRLFQALEVACCASLDGDTLDMITDMVPPRV